MYRIMRQLMVLAMAISTSTVFIGNSFADTVYVDLQATGTDLGNNWANACTTIQAGIDTANNGDEVWVAEGTYGEAIILKSGIAIYGGFNATETLLAQRDYDTYVTTIDASGIDASTVTINGVINSVIDGFVITGGVGTSGNFYKKRGGGVYINQANVTNIISHCTITENTCDWYGGGIHLDDSFVVITDCTISNNSSEAEGGGFKILNSSPQITNCIISNNDSFYGGGGIEMRYSSPIFTNCSIIKNTAESSSGVSIQFTSAPTFVNCDISKNICQSANQANGGGIYMSSSDGTFTNCTINNNLSIFGGGIIIFYGTVNFNGCTISGNIATSQGAGIYLTETATSFTDCTISNNEATGYQAGGVQIINCSPVFTNCIISGNKAASVGGGFFIDDTAAPILDNCIISGNSGYNAGGLYIRENSAPILTNCTISDNTALIGGGGMMLITGGSVALTNCILNNNDEQAIYEYSLNSDAQLTNCLFSNNPDGDYQDADTGSLLTGASDINALADVSNTNNIDGVPKFVTRESGKWTSAPIYNASSNTTTLTDNSESFTPDSLIGQLITVNKFQRFQALIVANTATTITVSSDLTGIGSSGDTYILMDYHIEYESSAINTGTATGAPNTDFDGVTRPQGLGFDIGAFEFLMDLDFITYSFGLFDTDNNGYLDSSEWAAAGLAPSYFTSLDDGNNQLTMIELLAAAGLTPNSLSTVYVDFGASFSGDGTSENPLLTLSEALGMVSLNGTGTVYMKPGESNEIFTNGAVISLNEKITLDRSPDGTNNPVCIGISTP